MKTILYPGTFDPITFGHIDLIKKALKIGDRLIVAISENSNKNYLFNSEERVSLVRKSLFTDLKMSQSKIKIISFNCLTTALCKKMKANIILRGLRAVSDFDYEFQMAGMNARLANDIETIFLTASENHQFVASRFVKEIALLGGDISSFVPANVYIAMKNKKI